MLKNLKALVPKQWQESKKNKAPPRPKSRPGITVLKRIKETMGNLASSLLSGHHYIENIEERATKLMGELNRMRNNESFSDITYETTNGNTIKAHSVVASFNDKLLEIILNPPDATNAEPVVNNEIHCDEKEDNNTIIEDDHIVSTETLTSASSEGDLVKALNGNDVIAKVTELTEPVEESPSEPQTEDKPVVDTDCDVTNEKSKDDCDEQRNHATNENASQDVNGTESVELETSEGFGNKEENLPAPLVQELSCNLEVETSAEASAQKEQSETLSEDQVKPPSDNCQKQNSDVTIDFHDVAIEHDYVTADTSFEDPVEVLLNFFYTSHINITSKNVDKLRAYAKQCEIDDVTIACDAFDNLLQTETDSLTSAEEKETVAANIRYQYSDPQMAVKMLEHFDKLRHNSTYTDITMSYDKAPCQCNMHSSIVAASSKVFAEAIANGKMISDVTKELFIDETLHPPDMNQQISQGIFSYFYTGKIPISTKTARPLIAAAHQLRLDDVIEGCAEFLENILSTQNIIPIVHVANICECEKLKTTALKFLERNFLSVTKTPEFMKVTKDWLYDVLASNDVSVDKPASESEYQIFEAVRKWVNFDLENRKKDIYEAMGSVRFPLINESHLINDVSTDLLIMDDDNFCDRVAKTITGKSACKFPESVSMRGKEIALLIGGSAPIVDETSDEQGYTAVAFSDRVTMYDVRTGCLKELTTLPETCSLHCAIAVDHFVIIAGGYDKYSCITNDVVCLDLASLTWTEFPPMKVKRSFFVLQSIRGFIYAVGGLTPNGYSAKVEKYDREKMKWEFVASLPGTLYKHAGCAYQDHILITGGSERSTNALSYSPTEDSWTLLKPLNHGRDCHAMLTDMDKVYVIGGDTKIFSIEEYNSSSECWQILAESFTDRIYLSGATILDNKIYLIGGWKEDDDALDDVKCFDPTTERWIPIETSLPFPRGSLTATTVRVPTSYFS